MGISLFFRTSKKINFFKNTLYNTIKNDSITKIILTYPYFQETDNFKLSNDIIIPAIKERSKKLILLTVAPYDSNFINKQNNSWAMNYKRFVEHFNKQLPSNLCKFYPTYYNKDNKIISTDYNESFSTLHAKLLIGLSGVAPILLDQRYLTKDLIIMK